MELISSGIAVLRRAELSIDRMLTGRSKLGQYGDIPELRDSAKRTEGTIVYLWLLLPSFD